MPSDPAEKEAFSVGMEQDHNRMHESSRRDAVSEHSSPAARARNTRLSLDLSGQRIFSRTSSLGRSSFSGSWRLGSTRPNMIIEGIPAETADDRVSALERAENDVRPGSLSRMGSKESSRRCSAGLSSDHGTIDAVEIPQELLDRIDSSMAQVGCRGNRLDDNEVQDGMVTFADDALILSFGHRSHEASFPSVVTPLTEEIVSPVPADSAPYAKEKNQMQNIASVHDKQYKLPLWLDYISYLGHLAVFGILGVYTRYLLQKLFGPSILGLTGDYNALYLDLPSNMLGSFLMGWVGFVFKTDLLYISDHLLVGLSTGYLGSLTTFSGWNQKLLESSAKGHWVYTVAGFLLGTFLVNYSIIVGVGFAGGLRKCIVNWLEKRASSRGGASSLEGWRVNTCRKHTTVLTAILLIWCLLWVLSGEFFRIKLDDPSSSASLWLAFLVGPPGVWIRWRLARLNGQGLGRNRMLKWLPVGTLSANVLAACIMAALATVSKAVNGRRCTIVISGIQLGFLGCLSTVSTFAAEIYGMWKTGHGWRAFWYITITLVASFALATLLFSVPVWVKNYQ